MKCEGWNVQGLRVGFGVGGIDQKAAAGLSSEVFGFQGERWIKVEKHWDEGLET